MEQENGGRLYHLSKEGKLFYLIAGAKFKEQTGSDGSMSDYIGKVYIGAEGAVHLEYPDSSASDGYSEMENYDRDKVLGSSGSFWSDYKDDIITLDDLKSNLSKIYSINDNGKVVLYGMNVGNVKYEHYFKSVSGRELTESSQETTTRRNITENEIDYFELVGNTTFIIPIELSEAFMDVTSSPQFAFEFLKYAIDYTYVQIKVFQEETTEKEAKTTQYDVPNDFIFEVYDFDFNDDGTKFNSEHYSVVFNRNYKGIGIDTGTYQYDDKYTMEKIYEEALNNRNNRKAELDSLNQQLSDAQAHENDLYNNYAVPAWNEKERLRIIYESTPDSNPDGDPTLKQNYINAEQHVADAQRERDDAYNNWNNCSPLLIFTKMRLYAEYLSKETALTQAIRDRDTAKAAWEASCNNTADKQRAYDEYQLALQLWQYWDAQYQAAVQERVRIEGERNAAQTSYDNAQAELEICEKRWKSLKMAKRGPRDGNNLVRETIIETTVITTPKAVKGDIYTWYVDIKTTDPNVETNYRLSNKYGLIKEVTGNADEEEFKKFFSRHEYTNDNRYLEGTSSDTLINKKAGYTANGAVYSGLTGMFMFDHDFEKETILKLQTVIQEDTGGTKTRIGSNYEDVAYINYWKKNIKNYRALGTFERKIDDRNLISTYDYSKADKFFALLKNDGGTIPGPAKAGTIEGAGPKYENYKSSGKEVVYIDIYTRDAEANLSTDEKVGSKVGDLLTGTVDMFCQMLHGLDEERVTTSSLEQDYRYIMYLYSGTEYGVTKDNIQSLKQETDSEYNITSEIVDYVKP